MSAATSPPARRLGTGRRDVRLAAGVTLVVLSVVLGGRLIATSGDRVLVWSLRQSLAAGTTLHEDDLVAVPAAADTVAAYVPQSTGVAGRTLARDVAPGELLPAAALADVAATDRRLVTVPVDPLHAPPGLARGERVDVYVSPKDGTSVGQDGVTVLPSLALAGALVADPGITDTAGTTSQVGVVLDVALRDAGRAVAAARGGDVDLVRVGTGP
ncbi:MAG: hypothetical protein M0Z98_01015 [Actinomycetales bacterium]|nr:hypothetical protein [Actinomycetales bacterium]